MSKTTNSKPTEDTQEQPENKSEKPEQQPAEPAPANDYTYTPKRWRPGSIFWGLLFIFIGTLVLLSNLGVVKVNFNNLWQLWPVFIIGAGVSMLSLRGWIAGVVMFLFTVAMLALAGFTAIENPYFNPRLEAQTQTTTIPSGSTSAKAIDLTIKTGATDLDLTSNADIAGVKATLESTHMELSSTERTKDDTQFINLETKSKSNFWIGPVSNKLSLDLTRNLPLSIHIDSGASSIHGDLSPTKLGNMDIKAGASSIDLKFGDLSSRLELSIDAGASSTKLKLPRDVGVRVYSEGGLSSIDLQDIPKKSDGFYESTGFDTAKVQITVRAKIGASSFEIDRY